MVVLTSFTQPTDGIRHRQPNTTVYVNDNSLGKGTVYIAESRFSWISDSGGGFSLEYPHISLHAISRDLNAFPQECLFLMLDTALGDEEGNENEEDDDNENGSVDQGTTELRLVPDDKGMLDAMFHEMNACQALHPDPEDSFSDEDFYEDADEEIPMEEADSRMASLRIDNMDERGGMAGGRRVGGDVGVADRVLGRQGDFGGVGNGGGRTEESDYIQVDMAEGRVGGMLGDRGEDMEVGRVGSISAYRRNDMGQDGRSFLAGNMWSQNRMEHCPAAHEPHTSPHDSNFDDVEY